MTEPIEVTTKYVTTVDSLPAAWEFVMDRLDGLAGRPSITISPLSRRGEFSDSWTEHFEVEVSAMTEEPLNPQEAPQ